MKPLRICLFSLAMHFTVSVTGCVAEVRDLEPTPIDPRTLCENVARAYYQRIAECSELDVELWLTVPYSEFLFCDQTGMSVANSRIAVDSVAAERCIAEAPTSDCSNLGPLTEVCRNVFEGMRELGESCVRDECREGLACRVSGETGCGTCELSDIARCVTFGCPEGQACTGDGDSWSCRVRLGGRCGAQADCAWDAFCDELGQCRLLAAGGAECSPGGVLCYPVWTCAIRESPTCEHWAGLGEACGAGVTNCFPIGECTDGSCQSVFGVSGQPCSEDRPCLRRLFCGDGICAEKKVVGEPCKTPEECRSGVCMKMRCAEASDC